MFWEMSPELEAERAPAPHACIILLINAHIFRFIHSDVTALATSFLSLWRLGHRRVFFVTFK